MTRWVRPIRNGWVVRDRVPGPDVDEFGDPTRVAAALAAPGGAEGTLLAVQHPHRTPAALAAGLGLTEALPIARAALSYLRSYHYEPVSEVVGLYEIDGADGSVLGVLCMVDPAVVGADGISHVRHTEDVYPDVVEERAAMLAGLGCATSAALLVPEAEGWVLTEKVREILSTLDTPAVSTVDSVGRRHRLWLLGSGDHQDEVIALAQRHTLLVADGNHRVAASAAAGSLLALVTGGPRLEIGPIHRALTGTGFSLAELASRWRAAGLDVRETDDRTVELGSVVVLAGSSALRVRLPSLGKPSIDHRVVEQVLIHEALGIDPEGPALVPILPGGRTVLSDVDATLLLAPVPLADLLATHAAGLRMPRKATYFTPKPRSGLLLADL
ncbi:Uncharacterized conserved protein, DUF1015 family [Amycolatopsis xylanica]|uniref:Uncharacterized conserved protein, DUF1015 family n=1 Tax=Amycolatopsis xylanica TaxID=589385 RepID=A0A1H2UFS9_9PSEU|nr:DUF1015 family protein [Amycolatopsis xylanica]SDW54986.1 Uncharacterized conserved protein, DUF1015 family [Amycolatopsis xylanica]